jgi:menaquinone C8-methyltransferase
MLVFLARVFRQYLAGRDCRFVFHGTDESHLAPLDSAHLYLHVPFCQQECPYCPYNKIPYERTLARRYVDGLIREIDLVRDRVDRLQVLSLYAGGGTPLLLGSGLVRVVDHLRDVFDIEGPLACEVNPSSLNNEAVGHLHDCGMTMASVGIQSFQDTTLKTIGRSYAGSTARQALEQLAGAGFETLNADLMFAVPGQTQAQLADDLKQAVTCGASQVTTYPLFTFPYTNAARHRKRMALRMPPFRVRYRQYRQIWRHFSAEGFTPASVWSFRKDGCRGYSSVTRKVYIGLGAGAATCIPGHYSFNTFDVPAYLTRLEENRLPVALHMKTTQRLEDWYWLYWQMYQTWVDKQGLKERFQTPGPSPYRVLSFCRRMGWIREEDTGYRMTESGAFWIHLAQNYLLLGSIDRLWQKAKAEPFPRSVPI